MDNWLIPYEIDLQRPETLETKYFDAAMGDVGAHDWTVSVLTAGAAADLSGMTARARFLRPDGVTVLVDGTITGNAVSVNLPQEVYAVAGSVRCSLRILTASMAVTIARVVLAVTQDASDTVADPGAIIPNLDTTIANVQAATADANDAAAAANLAAERAGMTVLGTYLFLGSLLSEHPTGAPGDAYLVGNTAQNSLYVWNPGQTEWTNAGPIGRYIRSNQSVAQQAGFATVGTLDGSMIPLPSAPVVGTGYRLTFDVTKTAAGTATPIITIHFGVSGNHTDPAILTFTFGAGTAAVDTGVFVVDVVFRTVGSGTAAVVQGVARLNSNLTTTGISNAVKARVATSAGFDSTITGGCIGAAYNGGTSAAHTVQLVRAELLL